MDGGLWRRRRGRSGTAGRLAASSRLGTARGCTPHAAFRGALRARSGNEDERYCLSPWGLYPVGGTGEQLPVSCFCVGDRRERLVAPSAAKAARRMGVRVEKVSVGVGANPWEMRIPPGPEPTGTARRAKRRRRWGSRNAGGAVSIHVSCQSVSGCRVRFAAPAGGETAPAGRPRETPK